MVLDLVLIGLAIAVDPVPLTPFMVVLPSERGVKKGAAFVSGWLVSLAAVVTVTVLVTADHPPKPGYATLGCGAGGANRRRRHPGRGRDPAALEDAAAGQAQEGAEVAGARGPHVPVVRPGPGARRPALGADRRGRGHGHRGQAVGPGSYLVLALFCILASASYLGIEGYAGLRPGTSQAFLARFRTWMETHTDQLIIWGGLILGFWLIGKSIYLLVG